MKDRYSIGEISAICNISVQALRYYTKIGLITPAYVNEETGYRYYSSDSIPMVDRIIYLKKFGLSLREIRDILRDGTPDALLPLLARQKGVALEQARRARELAEEIDWYIDYFDTRQDAGASGIPYIRRCPRRYVLSVEGYPGEPRRETYLRLLQVRHLPEFQRAEYHFQSTYYLDFDDLAAGRYVPRTTGVFLSRGFPEGSEYVSVLPEGEYLCFRGRLRVGDWDAGLCVRYFEQREKPSVVVANEHEGHFIDYEDSVFEVQMLISQTL